MNKNISRKEFYLLNELRNVSLFLPFAGGGCNASKNLWLLMIL